MSYLIDTNVLSELRKGKRADANLRAWFSRVDEEEIFLSVLVIGEIRRGIGSIGRRDPKAARALERWVRRVLRSHEDRILPVTTEIAEAWGPLNVPDPLPVIDSLIGATALVHGLTVATRNVSDIQRTGAPVVNPFDAS